MDCGFLRSMIKYQSCVIYHTCCIVLVSCGVNCHWTVVRSNPGFASSFLDQESLRQPKERHGNHLPFAVTPHCPYGY